MNKIVFIGDLHLSDRQITTRVDDSTETVLEKFEWILNYAFQQNANIICTGDMFTHTLYSNHTRYRIKKALKAYNSTGLSFWVISGNHSGDIEDRNPDSVLYRELGQFVLDGYVRFLGKFDEKGEDCILSLPDKVIRGYSAYSELYTGDAENVIGLVCHHWIMDAFGDSLVIYPDDMKKIFPNLQFIVAGHDHAVHQPYVSRDDVKVIRPGSVMRTDAGKSSQRIPCVVVCEFGEGHMVWETIPISISRPYEEVFYQEKRDVNKDSVNALDRFVQQIQEKGNVVMDLSSAVNEQLGLVPVADRDMIKQDLSANGFMIS